MSTSKVGMLRQKISQRAGALALRVTAYNGDRISTARFIDEMKHFGFTVKPQEDEDAPLLLTIDDLVFSVSSNKSVETQKYYWRLTLQDTDDSATEDLEARVNRAIQRIDVGIDAYRRSHHASGDNKAE